MTRHTRARRALSLAALATASFGCTPEPNESAAQHVYLGVRVVVDRPTSDAHWFDDASLTSDADRLASTYVIDEAADRVPLPNARLRVVWRETPDAPAIDLASRVRTDGSGHVWALWDFDYISFLEDNGLINDPSEVDRYLPLKDHVVVRFSFKVSTGQFDDLRTEAELTAPDGLGFMSHGDRVGIAWRLSEASESEERGGDDVLPLIEVQATLPVSDPSWNDHHQPNDLAVRSVAFYGVQQALQRYGDDLGLATDQVHRCASRSDGCGPNEHTELEVKFPADSGAYTPYSHRIQLPQTAGRSLWTTAHEIAHVVHLNAWEEHDWPLGLPNQNYGPHENWWGWGWSTEEYEWTTAMEGFATFMEAAAMIDPDAPESALFVEELWSVETAGVTQGECARVPFNVTAFYWDLYKDHSFDCPSGPCPTTPTSLRSIVDGWDRFPDGSCSDCEGAVGYDQPNIFDWRSHAEDGVASASTLDDAWTADCMDEASTD